MPRMVIALCFVALAMPALAQAPREPRLNQIITDVRDARDLARSIPNPALRKRIEQLLSRAELSARELQGQNDPAAHTSGSPVMSGDDLETFLAALNRQAFDAGKLRAVKTLAPAVRLKSEQAKQILTRFAFDKDRVEAAVVLHRLLVDPQLFALALEAFAFDSSRKEALQRIGVR